jgi:holo-[acyl-carrier protein] synthase
MRLPATTAFFVLFFARYRMILGIGIDIIEIARVRGAISQAAFQQRVFTEAEQQYCESRGAQKAASYAARWAGKEAVMKAFGTGLRGGRMVDIEILPDGLGCPHVHLHGYFAGLAAGYKSVNIAISLSHARENAIAQCIIETEDD